MPGAERIDLGLSQEARRGILPPRHPGGLSPRWRGDGSELFFFQPENMMMSIAPATQHAVPRSLFHLEGVIALHFDHDLARDGQRFLVRLTPEAEGAAGLRVALEWSRQLARRLAWPSTGSRAVSR